MWERIAASSLLLAGAFVLFAVFTAALFLLERKDVKTRKRKTPSLCVAAARNDKRAA